MNKMEQHIADVGHVRWSYPKADYYWFIGGATSDAGIQSRMKYRLARDLTALLSSCQRKGRTAVALLSDTQVDTALIKTIRAMPGWKCLTFGAKGFKVPDSDLVCCKTADLILCYGEPTDTLKEYLGSIEDPPKLMTRGMNNAGRVRQLIRPKITNPNQRFLSDVERLRRDRPNVTRGLQIRDEIDLRPQYNI